MISKDTISMAFELWVGVLSSIIGCFSQASYDCRNFIGFLAVSTVVIHLKLASFADHRQQTNHLIHRILGDTNEEPRINWKARIVYYLIRAFRPIRDSNPNYGTC